MSSGAEAGSRSEGQVARTDSLRWWRWLFFVLLLLFGMSVAGLLLMAWNDRRTGSTAGDERGHRGHSEGPVLRLSPADR